MKSLLSVLLLVGSASAFAECDRPQAPELPDGDTADLATMVEGQKAVKAYVAGTEAFLDCLMAEGSDAGEEEPVEQKMARIERHNAAVDEMEGVAGSFNEELKEYKAKAQ
jgi:hypothetical protein